MNMEQIVNDSLLADPKTPLHVKVKFAIQDHLKSATGVQCELSMINKIRWSLFVDGEGLSRCDELKDYVQTNGIGVIDGVEDYRNDPDDPCVCYFFE